MQKMSKYKHILYWLAPFLIILVSLFIGRYPIPIKGVISILRSALNGTESGWPATAETVVLDIRLMRALLGVLVGAGLAISGAALQGMFRNPLVDAGILGVSSGAGFGAIIAIIYFDNYYMTYLLAFLGGIIAVVLSYAISRIYRSSPTIMLVLGGVIVSSVFSSLISLGKYLADPYNQLPEITFWLMGSLARANRHDLIIAALPMIPGILGLLFIRWRLNVISLGDKEAQALGINLNLHKAIIVTCTTLTVAGAVCVSGTIGWIGLIIPHVARMLSGNDHRVLLPVSLSLGGFFLVVIDNLGRILTGAEIPIGVLTALVGAPFYVYLLRRTRGGGW